MKKSKTLLSLVLASTITLSALTLAGCGGSKALSFKDAYDFSAIGGIGLLSSTQTVEPLSYIVNNYSSTPQISENEQQEILSNLSLLKNSIGGKIQKSSVTESDNQNYQYQYSLTTKNVLGEQKVYTLYYNETVTEVERDEKETRLDGLVIADGITYTMIGEKEVEDGEREYTFKISLDAKNYVLVEQEFDFGEKEYSYTAVKNGVTIYQAEVEYEKNRNGTVSVGFSTTIDGVEAEYEYNYITKNGTNYIRVEIEKNGRKDQRAIIKVLENGTYQFVQSII